MTRDPDHTILVLEGIDAIQEEFDERGLGPSDLIVQVIVDRVVETMCNSTSILNKAEGVLGDYMAVSDAADAWCMAIEDVARVRPERVR